MTDRERLIELLDHKVDDDWYTSEEIADYLLTNGVTIPVRCKDCRYCMSDIHGLWCFNDYEHNLQPDDFCSRGERKNNG